ncbi:MAG: peptide-methionine (S)-S-oxide reductase MsrA [Candidatus Obscuribacterales bacterium]|nr:peptide-methionine (S)-S-oxide reductase MsrA [Candidatus Obscuribacterales bacterium]
MEKAMFGAGCFWGVEEAFRTMEGVKDTKVGYSGGATENPTYEQVCTDRTGHAEVIYIEFDPAVVSYEQLLDKFFTIHDPTQLNRQGPDVGKQYRTAVFFYSPEQEKSAKEKIEQLGKSGKFRAPIATEVTPAAKFYPAEEYHQRYLQKRGVNVCH